MENNYFRVLWWFLPYININWPQVYMCLPHLKPPLSSTPPAHTIPLGSLRAPDSIALLHASNLHWSSILHMVMYMFQYYSLKLSHPHFLPLSPKVCSLHLCLLRCPACRIIGTIFLNSIICINIQYLSFWLTSLSIIGTRFIYLFRTD